MRGSGVDIERDLDSCQKRNLHQHWQRSHRPQEPRQLVEVPDIELIVQSASERDPYEVTDEEHVDDIIRGQLTMGLTGSSLMYFDQEKASPTSEGAH